MTWNHTDETRKHLSEKAHKRYEDPAQREKTASSLRGFKRPAGRKLALEHRRNIARGLQGKAKTQGHKDSLAKVAVHSWTGGSIGDTFAAVLCPAGFIREYHVYYGELTVKTGFGLRRANFQLDFAHIEGKVNIELDGPGHKTTPEEDASRDIILRELGWRIIRIYHA